VARLTARFGPSTMIREQDLNLVLLRASLGTAAQHDPALAHLRFHLPSGPLRPLLPSLAAGKPSSSSIGTSAEVTSFDDLLLGAPMILSYKVTWPLDLFLYPSDLQIYSAIFSYLSSLRKTHTRIHMCWTSLSNAQRVRRRWTKLGEGGTAEDLELRTKLLRCSWGIVRDMGWFWDTLLGYLMTDVVDVEFRRLKDQLSRSGFGAESAAGFEPSALSGTMQPPQASGGSVASSQLDFNTLRNIHTTYLERLLTGCLLAYPTLTSIVRPIAEVCDRFVAQVERWGGDVLPALLFEGSLTSDRGVADMVKERWAAVAEINEVNARLSPFWFNNIRFTHCQSLHSLLEAFYEQLSMTTSQQPYSAIDASKSIVNTSMANASTFNHTFIRPKGAKGFESDGEVRRHVERLLLRLDFNGGFSVAKGHAVGQEILKEGGLL
jgi:gamma-tubulin complex component 4